MSEPPRRQAPEDAAPPVSPSVAAADVPRGRGLLFAWGAVGGLLGAFLGFVPDLLAGHMHLAAGLGWLTGGAAAGLVMGEFLDQRDACRRHPD